MAAGAGKLVAQFSGCTGLEPTGGRATSMERRRPPMPELGVGSAGGHFPYAWAVPGSHRAGPCDPGGAPYGRTEYGRPRCARGRIPGVGKGLRLTTDNHLSRHVTLVGSEWTPCVKGLRLTLSGMRYSMLYRSL